MCKGRLRVPDSSVAFVYSCAYVSRSLPALLRRIPEPLLERHVLGKLLTPQLLVDPVAMDVFRDLLVPRVEGRGGGLLSLPAFRRCVLPFYADCLGRHQRAVRIALLITLPRAVVAMPVESLRRTVFPEVRTSPTRGDCDQTPEDTSLTRHAPTSHN